jgi:hypothetical protein
VAHLEVTRRVWTLRRLKIEVDGEGRLVLPARATRTVDVPAGRHSVVARMDWSRSPPFEVTCDEAETTRLEVVVPEPFLAGFRAVFSPGTLVEIRLV